MAHLSRIEILGVAIRMGRTMIDKHRKHLAQLTEAGADPALVTDIQYKLELCEEAHADDVAELKRLTTQ